MKRNYLPGALLCLAFAACGTPANPSLTVPMTTVGLSGESGSAIITDKGNNTSEVRLALSGGSDVANSQQAHIHVGRCGSNGAIFVALNNAQGGQSVTTVNYSLTSLQGAKYYINVHNSMDVNTIVSCGNIP